MSLYNFALSLSVLQAQSAVLSYLDDAVGIGEVMGIDLSGGETPDEEEGTTE